MKTIPYRKILIIVLCFVLFLVLWVPFKELDSSSESYFLENFAYVDNDLKSDLYDYTLSFVKNDRSDTDEYFVAVKDENGVSVYQTQNSYRTSDTLLVTWDDQKLLFWIYSGDVGIYLVEFYDGKWIEYSRTYEEYPAVFVELEPNKFKTV